MIIHWLTILVSLVLVGLPFALMARRIQSTENLIDKQMVVIVAQDEHIAQLKQINQCNDRIIELKDRHIENAERRADNFEYLYNLAKNTCAAMVREDKTDRPKLMGYIANADYCMEQGDLTAAQTHLTNAMNYLMEDQPCGSSSES